MRLWRRGRLLAVAGRLRWRWKGVARRQGRLPGWRKGLWRGFGICSWTGGGVFRLIREVGAEFGFRAAAPSRRQPLDCGSLLPLSASQPADRRALPCSLFFWMDPPAPVLGVARASRQRRQQAASEKRQQAAAVQGAEHFKTRLETAPCCCCCKFGANFPDESAFPPGRGSWSTACLCGVQSTLKRGRQARRRHPPLPVRIGWHENTRCLDHPVHPRLDFRRRFYFARLIHEKPCFS